MLSDRHIRTAMHPGYWQDFSPLGADGPLQVSPGLEDWQFQPASLELTLSNRFRDLYGHAWEIPPMPPAQQMTEQEAEAASPIVWEPQVIHPGQLILASTEQTVRIPNWLAARAEGKSSLGRKGLAVHVTAGFIDPGFEGDITLELVNHGPKSIVLMTGMPICQLAIFKLSSPVERPYGHPDLKSHYQGQSGPTAARA